MKQTNKTREARKAESIRKKIANIEKFGEKIEAMDHRRSVLKTSVAASLAVCQPGDLIIGGKDSREIGFAMGTFYRSSKWPAVTTYWKITKRGERSVFRASFVFPETIKVLMPCDQASRLSAKALRGIMRAEGLL